MHHRPSTSDNASEGKQDYAFGLYDFSSLENLVEQKIYKNEVNDLKTAQFVSNESKLVLRNLNLGPI
jgi:hypothetical protein